MKITYQKAYQTDDPLTRVAYASLIVTVLDVNDHAPVMVSPTYEISIPEHYPEAIPILTVSAYDDDIVSIHYQADTRHQDIFPRKRV